MNDIIIYLQLRCSLVEIQNRTEPVTVKVGQRSNFIVVAGGRVSPLHHFIPKYNNSHRILKE
ncbi:hypothetical protein V1477_001043 [Vespula maculifrons]|uniref:Uncharacterized protein n=1 Tax=Vespula maculifrons TaxID=7453 RepID=A0ABD2D263_VESMC